MNFINESSLMFYYIFIKSFIQFSYILYNILHILFNSPKYLFHFNSYLTISLFLNPNSSTSPLLSYKISLRAIDDISSVHDYLTRQLQNYNQQFGMSPLTVILSECVVRHVIRLNRVLSYSDEFVFFILK